VCVTDKKLPVKLIRTWRYLTLTALQPWGSHIPWVELEDHGKYICHAQNPLGTQIASVRNELEDILEQNMD
jgi:hypothetical protein